MVTEGLANLMAAVAPGDRPSGEIRYPGGLGRGSARRKDGEDSRDWLRRSVRKEFEDDVGRVAAEDNLVVFLDLRWENSILSYANVQALWTNVSTRSFHEGADGKHTYLRLDYDPGQPGPVFKEPQPHVHVQPEGEPRFPIPLAASDDMVGWFLDFVYRNFFYEEWISWAEEEWNQWWRQRSPGVDNPWSRVVQAFNTGKTADLDAGRKGDLIAFQEVIRQKWGSTFPHRASDENRSFFSYR